MVKRILYVEPHADSRFLMELFLAKHGYEVTLACTAEEALQSFHTQRFDACLLDNWLPRMSGIELCRYIFAIQTDAIVLFYSGAAYPSDIAQGINAGAQAYLTKPTGFSLLPETLARLIKEKRVTADQRNP